MTIKLQQGQLWQQGEEYLRIVRLERLVVKYKSTLAPAANNGIHHRVSKKDFCRRLKKANLPPPAAPVTNATCSTGAATPPYYVAYAPPGCCHGLR